MRWGFIARLSFILVFLFISFTGWFGFLYTFHDILIIYIFQMHVYLFLVDQRRFEFLETSSVIQWFLLQVEAKLWTGFEWVNCVSDLSYLTFSVLRFIVILAFYLKLIFLVMNFKNVFSLFFYCLLMFKWLHIFLIRLHKRVKILRILDVYHFQVILSIKSRTAG